MRGEGDLHGFVARLVGWTRAKEIEQALVSIRLAVARSAHLVLRGAGDMVPIAYALHRRTLGTDKPFVVCDPRRGDTSREGRAGRRQYPPSRYRIAESCAHWWRRSPPVARIACSGRRARAVVALLWLVLVLSSVSR